MTKQFEVGKTYWTRSACDYDCVHSLTVVSRTEKTIIADLGSRGQKRLGIRVWGGEENVKPFGSYSMAAVIGAASGDKAMPE